MTKRLSLPSCAASPKNIGGRYHNLELLYASVNATEFNNQVDVQIIWGNNPSNYALKRKSIIFGTYSQKENLIRIHPFLDQAFVPTFFVRYIVFHEILHAFLGVKKGPNGRRRIHPPEFKRREREYYGYERAIAWDNDPKNLGKLLAPYRKRQG